jgi:hypothetical protein
VTPKGCALTREGKASNDSLKMLCGSYADSSDEDESSSAGCLMERQSCTKTRQGVARPGLSHVCLVRCRMQA